MSNEENKIDKEIERTKLLLDLMEHRYEEEERRNESIDSKNSTMLAVIGVMFTLQSTIFTRILIPFSSGFEEYNIYLLILFVSSLICYIFALLFFIYSHHFKTNFISTPSSNWIVTKAKTNDDIIRIIRKMLISFNKAITNNKKVIENKIFWSNNGFYSFLIGGVFTILFCLIFLLKYYNLI